MTRTKDRIEGIRKGSREAGSMEIPERASEKNFAPKKKKKKPTHLERLAECNISEELRVSIALALKKLESSDEQKAELELPSSLTSEERKYIHIVAQQMGFKSKSRGPKDCRTPTICKKDPSEQPKRLKSWKRRALRYGGVEELKKQKAEREKIRDLETEHERLLQLEASKDELEDSGEASSTTSGTEHNVQDDSAAVAPTSQLSRPYREIGRPPSGPRGAAVAPYNNHRPQPPFGRDGHPHFGRGRGQPPPPKGGFNPTFHHGQEGYPRREYPMPPPPARNGLSVARPCSPFRPPKLEMDDSTWIMLDGNNRPQPPQEPPAIPAMPPPPPPVLYGQPFRVPEPLPFDRSFNNYSDGPPRPHEPNYAEMAGRSVPQGPHHAGPHPEYSNLHQRHDYYATDANGVTNDLRRPSGTYLRERQTSAIPFSFGNSDFKYDPVGLVIRPSEPAAPSYGYYTRNKEPSEQSTYAHVKEETMSGRAGRNFHPDEVKMEPSYPDYFETRADGAMYNESVDPRADLERQERTIMSCVGAEDELYSSDDDDHMRGAPRYPRINDHQAPRHPDHRTHRPRQNVPLGVRSAPPPLPQEHHGYDMRNPDSYLHETRPFKREASPDINSFIDFHCRGQL